MRRVPIVKIVFLSLFLSSLWSCGKSSDGGGSSVQETVNESTSPVSKETYGATDGAKTFEGFIDEVKAGHFAKLEDYLYQMTGSQSSNGLIYYTKISQQDSSEGFWDSLKNSFSFEFNG